jgi:hypothetical protein
MNQQTLNVLIAATLALPLLVLASIAYIGSMGRLKRRGLRRSALWAQIGSLSLAIHAVAPVCVRYVSDFMVASALELRQYALLVTLLNAISFIALLLALVAFVVAMFADRVVLPNPSLERP